MKGVELYGRVRYVALGKAHRFLGDVLRANLARLDPLVGVRHG